jgi:DNA-binding transcriptional MerR regulator
MNFTVRTLNSPPLRTVDVARRSGYSVQQVRKLEHEGVLPPASRSATGYRQYGESHVQALTAYRALAIALGPVSAKQFLRDARSAPVTVTLAAFDEAHSRLHGERAALAAARQAARYIAGEPMVIVSDDDWMGVSELASALGVRASTLRYWDAEGLVVPDRSIVGQARRYSPQQVRDARVVHQLRSVGNGVDSVRRLLPALRAGLRASDLESAFTARQDRIAQRSRALLEGAAPLLVLLKHADASRG